MKSLQLQMQVAEARGEIPAGSAFRVAAGIVLEAATVAFYQAFYGQDEWNKARESARAQQHDANERVGALRESLLSDLGGLRRLQRETQTTSDIPLTLSNIRNRVVRSMLTPVESPIIELANKRTAQDFRTLKGIRFDTMNRELPVRPEGEDVHYAKISATEDGYRVANYELAIAYTWEMAKNDDISTIQVQMAELGRIARQTRAGVLYAAMLGLARTTLDGAAGGPTINRVEAARLALATLSDAKNNNLGYMADALIVPAKWDGVAKQTLNSEDIRPAEGQPTGNPAYQSLRLISDRAMAAKFGDDWLVVDSSRPWLEYAVLQGFEGGPRTYVKAPDVKDFEEDGSFDNHSLAIKVGDAVGAKITDDKAVIRVKGS